MIAARARGAAFAMLLAVGSAAADERALREECVTGLRYLSARETIRFAPSSARLPGNHAAFIDEIASLMAECAGAVLVIEGHTDDRGDPERNRALSEARARAVAEAIAARGIAAERLQALGLGGSRPIADNDTRDGRRLNRRIELRLEPAPDQRDVSSAGTENRTTVSRRPGTPASYRPARASATAWRS